MSVFSLLQTDADLVRGAQSDRPGAFETLVCRYQRRAHAIARAAGVRADALDDVVQEAFLEAFRHLGQVRVPAAFGSWFLSIVRNLSLKHQARERTRGTGVAEGVELERLPDPRAAGAPEMSVETRELHEKLWLEVDRLPQGMREAVFLYYYEGKSTRRVAQSLGITRSAVKNRLLRGREILREQLWNRLSDVLFDEVPAPREWKRTGRRLALLVMAAGTPGAVQAAAAKAGVSNTGNAAATGSVIVRGVSLMCAKKTLVGMAAVVLCLGGIAVLYDPDVPAGSKNVAKPESIPTPAVADDSATVLPEESAPATAERAGTEPSGISGLVVYAESGLPAAGARVAVVAAGDREASRPTTSGDDGSFLVELPPGTYRLWCSKGTWATRIDDFETDVVEVRKNEMTRGVRRSLIRGGLVNGEVVVEASGERIANALVDFARLLVARTDDSGRFRLEGLPPGGHTVRAGAPAYTRDWAYANISAGEEVYVRLRLSPAGILEGTVFDIDGLPAAGIDVGGTRSVRTDENGRYRLDDLPLETAGMTITASRHGMFATSVQFDGFPVGETRAELDIHLQPARSIRGVVIDASSEPVAGAKIHLQGSMIFEEIYRTDDDGRFVIPGATNRIFLLTAKKKGFAPANVSLKDLPMDEWEDLSIALEPGHFVAGVVVDTVGDPVEGAFVYVEAKVRGAGRPASARTDSSGSFRIEELPAELGEIGALKEGYADNRFNPVEADRDDLRLVLVESGRIDGVVVDQETGAPVFPVQVKVSLPDGKFRQLNRQKKYKGGLSARLGRRGLHFNNEDGTFTVQHELAPDYYYRLMVQAEGYAEAVLPGVKAWGRSTEREPIRVALTRGRALLGQVVVAGTGEPLEGVTVRHFVDSGSGGYGYWSEHRRGDRRALRNRLTDAEGRFSIEGLGPEPGVLLLTKQGYGRTALFRILPGAELRVFELAPAAGIEGRVETSQGEPIAEASIEVKVDGLDYPGVSTDGSGYYRIDELPVGTAELTLRRKGAIRRVASVQTRARAIVEVHFTISSGSIAGRVTEGGKPVAATSVLVKNVARVEEREWSETDATGAFRIEGLSPGQYEVLANPPDRKGMFYEGVRRTVEVYSGETRCDLSLAPEGSIHGVVVDRLSGEAVHGAMLELFRYAPEFLRQGALSPPFGGWYPLGREKLDADAAVFELPIRQSGKYLVTAYRHEPTRIHGWLGPIELEAAKSAGPLTVRVGGAGRATIEVLDDRGAPLAGVWPRLQPATGYPVTLTAGTDAAGVAELVAVPPGEYVLEVGGPTFGLHRETVRIGEEACKRTVRLERAAWLVLEIEGLPLSRKKYAAHVIALSGGDPGWRLDTRQGRAAESVTFDGNPIRMRTRPGGYRLRIDLFNGPYADAPRRSSHELDVTVPESGEARVRVHAVESPAAEAR